MKRTTIRSPIGDLGLAAAGGALRYISFAERIAALPGVSVESDEDVVLRSTARQLDEYFAGRRVAFDLPLELAGTAFQRRVWDRLQLIPYGETISYGRVAADLGLPPGASRAVGLANGANPIPVVVPCHRVVGANGTLTGYGGGLARKQHLLSLELEHSLFSDPRVVSAHPRVVRDDPRVVRDDPRVVRDDAT
jgi:methylated-DNA-[protein]-cysteine S-methyltransferase